MQNIGGKALVASRRPKPAGDERRARRDQDAVLAGHPFRPEGVRQTDCLKLGEEPVMAGARDVSGEND